jgi:cytochrome c oxidase cbb3-type subunit 1
MENIQLLSEWGIIITLVLISIPILTAALIVTTKTKKLIADIRHKRELEAFEEYARTLDNPELELLQKRKEELAFKLHGNELKGNQEPQDSRGMLGEVSEAEELRFIPKKQREEQSLYVSKDLSKLILWYLGTSVVWLIFGTTVGEYLGIKFVAPDIDQESWLSFGRLRPVHTNSVFWGWASLAMLGLAYYVVPRVSNAPIVSLRKGYYTLVLVNLSVLLGSLSLMAGVNNGGGE